MTTFEAAEPPGPTESEPTAEALAQQARQAVEALARLSDPAAFTELLRLSAFVGECLGVSARSLADGGSWAHVAEAAGVTRQAAWSRWRSESS
jgi:hypothetical protein